MDQINLKELTDLIKRALKEDLGGGDITTKAIIPHWKRAKAKIIAKEEGVLAGLFVAELVFKTVNRKTEFKRKKGEGYQDTEQEKSSSKKARVEEEVQAL